MTRFLVASAAALVAAGSFTPAASAATPAGKVTITVGSQSAFGLWTTGHVNIGPRSTGTGSLFFSTSARSAAFEMDEFEIQKYDSAKKKWADFPRYSWGWNTDFNATSTKGKTITFRFSFSDAPKMGGSKKLYVGVSHTDAKNKSESAWRTSTLKTPKYTSTVGSIKTMKRGVFYPFAATLNNTTGRTYSKTVVREDLFSAGMSTAVLQQWTVTGGKGAWRTVKHGKDPVERTPIAQVGFGTVAPGKTKTLKLRIEIPKSAPKSLKRAATEEDVITDDGIFLWGGPFSGLDSSLK
ncbi:hypothetical protein ACFV06_10955 [Streptomyces sp. NPDC059618]|uniref:hypothetical protein n=1 Tax=Streptomyces sp. NPDC059618 TaxID=3346887 RepID=UPI00369CA293